jgi:hypothetical protein
MGFWLAPHRGRAKSDGRCGRDFSIISRRRDAPNAHDLCSLRGVNRFQRLHLFANAVRTGCLDEIFVLT